jgi:hypothetical protein
MDGIDDLDRFAWIKPDAVAAGFTDPILKRIKEER